jgi:hypothetical protein
MPFPAPVGAGNDRTPDLSLVGGSISAKLVGLTGACSNQPTSQLLADANRARAALVAQPGASSPTIRSFARPKPMQPMIVLVLQASDVPLAIAEVLKRVEQVLGRSVNRASLKAALSEMAISQNHPIRRVSRGCYESTPFGGRHRSSATPDMTKPPLRSG